MKGTIDSQKNQKQKQKRSQYYYMVMYLRTSNLHPRLACVIVANHPKSSSPVSLSIASPLEGHKSYQGNADVTEKYTFFYEAHASSRGQWICEVRQLTRAFISNGELFIQLITLSTSNSLWKSNRWLKAMLPTYTRNDMISRYIVIDWHSWRRNKYMGLEDIFIFLKRLKQIDKKA